MVMPSDLMDLRAVKDNAAAIPARNPGTRDAQPSLNFKSLLEHISLAGNLALSAAGIIYFDIVVGYVVGERASSFFASNAVFIKGRSDGR